jgi:hypothetical protein
MPQRGVMKSLESWASATHWKSATAMTSRKETLLLKSTPSLDDGLVLNYSHTYLMYTIYTNQEPSEHPMVCQAPEHWPSSRLSIKSSTSLERATARDFIDISNTVDHLGIKPLLEPPLPSLHITRSGGSLTIT